MFGIQIVVIICCTVLGFLHGERIDNYKQLLLDLHNDYRSLQKASDMQELSWDETLAEEAQSWADGCKFEHQRKTRGENLAFDSNDKTIEDKMHSSLKAWYDEINYYNYYAKRCGASCHYTQMVWAKTRKVGCGMKQCSWLYTGYGSPVRNAWYLVCFYFPKGNDITQYPYTKGTACTECLVDQTCSSAGLCTGGEEVDLFPCENKEQNCEKWKGRGDCGRNRNYMEKYCAKACGFCKKAGGSGENGTQCDDRHIRCNYWASIGECERNPGYMIYNCRKSCNTCDEDQVDCVDENTSCNYWASIGECDNNPGYMLTSCQKSCNSCTG